MAAARHSHSDAAQRRRLVDCSQARRALDSPKLEALPLVGTPIVPAVEALTDALQDERRDQAGPGCGPSGPC
jgi:hypothetical protein